MSSLAILGSAALPPAASPATLGTAGAGYNLSLADLGGFEQALQRAQARGDGRLGVENVGSSQAAAMFKPFDHINAEASSLAQMADAARAAGAEMTPGEVVGLTLRCQEFMFHCQLTSNIANRSSDGLSQLFRQQG